MNCNIKGIQLVINMWGLIKKSVNLLRFVLTLKENSEKYVEAKDIMRILTSYKGHQVVLELKEKDLILLQDEFQGTNDALTLTEAAEVANDEPEQTRQPSRS